MTAFDKLMTQMTKNVPADVLKVRALKPNGRCAVAGGLVAERSGDVVKYTREHANGIEVVRTVSWNRI